METSHFPSPSRGRERYRASGHEAACAGNTRLFARAEAARVTAMLLLVASGSKGASQSWRTPGSVGRRWFAEPRGHELAEPHQRRHRPDEDSNHRNPAIGAQVKHIDPVKLPVTDMGTEPQRCARPSRSSPV